MFTAFGATAFQSASRFAVLPDWKFVKQSQLKAMFQSASRFAVLPDEGAVPRSTWIWSRFQSASRFAVLPDLTIWTERYEK